MRSDERSIARKQLDKKLNISQFSDSLRRPSRGWIRAFREALGMTTTQLAQRLGVSQPRAVAIEKGEQQGSVTLESLEKAAHALDCQLVYILVPQKSLQDMIEERAERKAKQYLSAISHSMLLEDQQVEHVDEKQQLQRLIKQLIKKSGSELWEDNE